MKKYIILPLLLITTLCFGQTQFVIQNKNKTEVYNNINDAITNSVSGDTIYIPGGGFSIAPENLPITKTLHWVGCGHYPSDTEATMQTRITTALSFSGTCDYSSFEGIWFISTLSFGSSDDETTNVLLKRCRINGTLTLRQADTGNPVLNSKVQECITATIDANNGSLCEIKQTMIFGKVEDFYNSEIIKSSINFNNGYYDYQKHPIRNCYSCSFIDNVFSYDATLSGTESCTFDNNIFATTLPFTDLTPNSGSNNIHSVGPSNIYTTITGNVETFSYSNDYHLKTSSTGTKQDGTTNVSILNTASDNTNSGVFGGANPYKSIPYYPHINSATVANRATNNQLGVNITVKAQEH